MDETLPQHSLQSGNLIQSILRFGALDVVSCGANHIAMDDYRYIAIEEALRALQASNEALHADSVLVRDEVAAVQSTVNRLQGDVNKLQSDVIKILSDVTKIQSDVSKVQGDVSKVQGEVASQQGSLMQVQAEVTILNGKFDFFIEHYAKKVDVEMVRTEFYKAMEAQTWRLITWMTVVCSALTTAVYFIARNVH